MRCHPPPILALIAAFLIGIASPSPHTSTSAAEPPKDDGQWPMATKDHANVRYSAYSLAYGHALNEKLSLGVTGKVIQARLSDVSASAYAADRMRTRKPRAWLAATISPKMSP